MPRRKLALVLYNQEGEEEAVNKHAFVGAGTEIRHYISFRDEMIWERKERACHKQGRTTVWRMHVCVVCVGTGDGN